MAVRYDLNLLPIFIALMEERSVTRAAKRLGMTQPALSNALARLRYRHDAAHRWLRTLIGDVAASSKATVKVNHDGEGVGRAVRVSIVTGHAQDATVDVGSDVRDVQ